MTGFSTLSRLEASFSLFLAAAALVGVASLAVGCADDTECGPGTVLTQGECVPLQAANCSGDGVRFVNGVCLPDFREVCGEGTTLDSETNTCISTNTGGGGGDTGGGGTDTGGGGTDTGTDAGTDAGEDALTDLGEDVQSDGGDDAGEGDVTDVTDEEVAEAPTCADDLVAGSRICIRGQVLNFLSLAAAPDDADPPLQVQAKDLLDAATAAFAGQNAASLAEVFVGASGAYILPGIDITDDASKVVLMIVGEDEDVSGTDPEGPGTNWMRTISGQVNPDSAGPTYDEIQWTVPMSAVTGWNTALSLTGLDSLQATGFVLLRVMDTGQAPVSGVVVNANDDCGDDAIVSYFTDAVYADPTGSTSTGPTGMVLIRGSAASQDCLCSAASGGVISAACGSSPGRLTVGRIIVSD